MLDSRPSFNMTRDQIDHFPIIFTKNIQEFKNNPDNQDERLTLFYLKETRNTILDLLVDNNIDKVNERLNKAGPKEAAVIQQTINDINLMIENEDPNIKITQEFQEIVDYIEKESQNELDKKELILHNIKTLESRIYWAENYDKENNNGIDVRLEKKLLKLVEVFYEEDPEPRRIIEKTSDNNYPEEKRDGKFVRIGRKL